MRYASIRYLKDPKNYKINMKIFLKYDINKMDQLNKNNIVPLFTIN